MRLDGYLSIQHRKWRGIQKNHGLMRDLILELMENPATEPEHLAQAHAMYADTCKALHDVSFIMDKFLSTGKKPTQEEMGAYFPKIIHMECSCGEKYSEIADGKYRRCPACGML